MEQTSVIFEEVARLADTELIVGLQRWVRADRALTARLLVHLGEVDARGLYRERAWPSMFAYAVGELHMSESEAYVRIAAARLGRQFPRVVELEFHHHDTPYARGGAATTDNLKTVCRMHNALLAERDFGRAFMHSKLLHARLRKRNGTNELVLRREQE